MENYASKLSIGLFLFLIYGILLLLEHQFPLRKTKRPFIPRLVINISFTAMVFITALLLISPSIDWSFRLSENTPFGVLYFLDLNPVLSFIIGFLLMDLTFYYWHRLNHEIPLLWRFHNVHHCDPDLDVTTSLRFHFVEIVYSVVFRVAQLVLIGLSPLAFISYEFVFQASTFFHHSNLRLPLTVERILNKILVTPRMHGIHHSDFMNETNSNYSVVFSFWDRIHKSIKLNVPQEKICIGVSAYLEEKDNTFVNLLLMPFKRQRYYWQRNHIDHKQRSIQFSKQTDKMLG